LKRFAREGQRRAGGDFFWAPSAVMFLHDPEARWSRSRRTLARASLTLG
jgi:hypothetical protein